MLSIFPVKNIEYYKESSQDDYYQNSNTLPGEWIGTPARSLGIAGKIETSVYENLMQGFSPEGDVALVQNAGENHIPAYDFTFSAPKSVSILEALDKSGAIRKAQDKAVKATFRVLEQKAAMTRRNSAGKTHEQLPGLIGGLFTHFESRSEDMQLHTHCLVLNLAQRGDLTWGVIESKYLFRWGKAIGAIYRAELTQNLRELGYEIEADGESFKIKGVPTKLCDFFSKRTHQIAESLKELGASTSASSIGDRVKLFTRSKKLKTPPSELRARWKRQLNDHGFTCHAVEMIRQNDPTLASSINDAEIALNELTATKSTFREQDLYYQIAKQAQLSGDRSRTILQMAQQGLTSPDVVRLSRDPKGNQLYTTKEVIAVEKEMISLAKELHKSSFLAPDQHTLQAAIEKKQKDSGYELTDEQKEALELACSAKQIAIIQGSAGAGKSASMEALKIACKGVGQVVEGACIAKIAADNLHAETGIPSRTIAKLIHDYEQGKRPLASADVLLIDEAGQVGCKQMLTLLTMARDSHTKVVLVGEDKQLDAIERGGVLSYLSRPEVIGTARIETIQRQNTPWACQVVTDFRDGKVQAALQTLNTHNLINFYPSFEGTINALVDKWKTFTELSDKKAVVLAQRWKEVNALSVQLRNIYQERGLVQHQDIEFECSVSSKSMLLPFSIGDRVRFSKNDYRLGVSNGTLGTLESIDLIGNQWTFCVELDSGQKVSFGQDQYIDELGRLPLVHAYAMTVYSSQGVTVYGDTFILYNQNMDRANSYVAGSRHKDNSHFFVNERDLYGVSCHELNENTTVDEKIDLLCKRMSMDSQVSLAINLLDVRSRAQEAKGPSIGRCPQNEVEL